MVAKDPAAAARYYRAGAGRAAGRPAGGEQPGRGPGGRPGPGGGGGPAVRAPPPTTDPAWADPHVNLGRLLLSRGRPDLARPEFAAAVPAGPVVGRRPPGAGGGDDAAGRPVRPARLPGAARAVTAAVYWPAGAVRVRRLRRRRAVYQNPHVRAGLTAADVRWAVTGFAVGHWEPLTWLSLQADATVWHLRPGPMHVENVLLHAAGSAVLYGLLAAATGRPGGRRRWPALFAVHPVHVESVAWVTERRDVLSTPLLLAAVWAYVRHARAPGRRRYAAFLAAVRAEPGGQGDGDHDAGRAAAGGRRGRCGGRRGGGGWRWEKWPVACDGGGGRRRWPRRRSGRRGRPARWRRWGRGRGRRTPW